MDRSARLANMGGRRTVVSGYHHVYHRNSVILRILVYFVFWSSFCLDHVEGTTLCTQRSTDYSLPVASLCYNTSASASAGRVVLDGFLTYDSVTTNCGCKLTSSQSTNVSFAALSSMQPNQGCGSSIRVNVGENTVFIINCEVSGTVLVSTTQTVTMNFEKPSVNYDSGYCILLSPDNFNAVISLNCDGDLKFPPSTSSTTTSTTTTTQAPTTVTTTTPITTPIPTTITKVPTTTTNQPTTNQPSTTEQTTTKQQTTSSATTKMAPMTTASTTSSVSSTTMSSTDAPSTYSPTTMSSTEAPSTYSPTTMSSTDAPSTYSPTTKSSTEAPSTYSPTTRSSTEAPSTYSPTTRSSMTIPTTAQYQPSVESSFGWSYVIPAIGGGLILLFAIIMAVCYNHRKKSNNLYHSTNALFAYDNKINSPYSRKNLFEEDLGMTSSLSATAEIKAIIVDDVRDDMSESTNVSEGTFVRHSVQQPTSSEMPVYAVVNKSIDGKNLPPDEMTTEDDISDGQSKQTTDVDVIY